ncbi:YrrC family ATP-dependent DNA helicase [Oribacterium sp. P6A1]|uniref:YrrC family ATP-dependent DNA helicase n=1 Tax=Oribacterium sp. P6A1 TaxID=1410612 RepID=UPI0005623895|nr:hypothetical protein [Oribacterium sp. P6A1]
MQKIRCVVERITYQNPENGYSVMKCNVKDYSELVTVIGNLFVDFSDMANVRLCLEKSMEADLMLQMSDNGEYVKTIL